MSQNGSVDVDAAGNVVVGAPVATASGRAPMPYGEPASEVAVVNLGVQVAPRVLVAMLNDGSPVLYQLKEG
jgi:hypothetical protein